MTARFIVGDVFDVLATIPDNSVDLVLTSPPFLALRSYLPADHPDKAKEIGSEPTPGAFIDTLLALTEEWARVLAPHGSICVELGDTYSGSGGAGGDYNAHGLREDAPKFVGSASARRNASRILGVNPDWPQAKSLCLIPEIYRISLVYGFNPLTGRETPRWRARNVVRWCRPNPPVGALGDKFRPATSEMVVACQSPRRDFDLDAVRTTPTQDPATYTGNGYTKGNPAGNGAVTPMAGNAAGAPPLDWWQIPTEPYAGSHYATFPRELCVRPIRAMCPERVCRVCGEPSERITEPDAEYAAILGGAMFDGATDDPNVRHKTQERDRRGNGLSPEDRHRKNITLGWSDCGHDDYRPGVVLDPFAGSGTTLQVATGHGRDAIGIDLDARNADLARERCGMFLTVE